MEDKKKKNEINACLRLTECHLLYKLHVNKNHWLGNEVLLHTWCLTILLQSGMHGWWFKCVKKRFYCLKFLEIFYAFEIFRLLSKVTCSCNLLTLIDLYCVKGFITLYRHIHVQCTTIAILHMNLISSTRCKWIFLDKIYMTNNKYTGQMLC